MSQSSIKKITVSVVRFNNKILLLRRNQDKHFDPNKWEFVSGFIKSRGNITELAKNQVSKETQLDVRLAKEGATFRVTDMYGTWLIHPYLFDSRLDRVELIPDDHVQYVWIDISDLHEYDTVTGLDENLKQLGLI